MIRGFKVFDIGLVNRNKKKFEVGKTYSVSGEIKFGNKGNGLHFCQYISDGCRYFNKDIGMDIAQVSTMDTGEDIIKFDDDDNDCYELYVCRNLLIERILERKEIISEVLKLQNYQIINFLSTYKLTIEECQIFMAHNKEIEHAVRFHQLGDKDIYFRLANCYRLHS